MTWDHRWLHKPDTPARQEGVKYVDNKYKNAGIEPHNCFLFYGGNVFKQFKIKLEGKLFLPWTSKSMDGGSTITILIVKLNLGCLQWCIRFFNSPMFLPESSKTNNLFHAIANSFSYCQKSSPLPMETWKWTHKPPWTI